MKIRNQLNSKSFEKNYETNEGPDMCIPDQSMTVREIMDRFTRGLPLDQGKVPIYEGEEYTPDLLNMDLVDRHEYMEGLFASARSQEKEQNVENQQIQTLETQNEH